MSSISTHFLVYNNIKSTAHFTMQQYLPEITGGFRINNFPAWNTTRHLNKGPQVHYFSLYLFSIE
jgi:hypothetical protein